MSEVIIAGWMDYSVHRDSVLALLQPVGAATRDEEGCLAYSMTADATDAGRIRVFEWWSSSEALDAHLQMRHVKEFREAVTEFPRIDRLLQRFLIAKTETF